jgi:hypothetical protein
VSTETAATLRRVNPLRAIPIVAAAAAGVAAAIALTVPAVAQAWSPTNLPPGVTIVQHGSLSDPSSPCAEWWYLKADGAVSPKFCTDSPTYQQDFDAWVDAHYTPPATTTAPPTTTGTDTTATTTAAPSATTTTTALPAGDPGATTTTATPTQTVTVTVTAIDPTINDRLTALEQQYAALAARVDAIAQANTAAWSAFVDALNSGASTVDAALAARSAGLNAIYQLG